LAYSLGWGEKYRPLQTGRGDDQRLLLIVVGNRKIVQRDGKGSFDTPGKVAAEKKAVGDLTPPAANGIAYLYIF
jgi:hypothetical protein